MNERTSTPNPVSAVSSHALVPVGPYDDRSALLGRDDDLISLYGWCAEWCTLDIVEGEDVSDHGPFCESASHCVKGVDAAEVQVGIYPELTRQFMHGLYRGEDIRRTHHQTSRDEVRLVIIGSGVEPDDEFHEGKSVYLSVDAARGLAAKLQHLVDAADNLDRPLRRRKS